MHGRADFKKNYKTVVVVYGVQIILSWWRLNHTAELNASPWCAKSFVLATVRLRLNTCDLVEQTWLALADLPVTTGVWFSFRTPRRRKRQSSELLNHAVQCFQNFLLADPSFLPGGGTHESSHPCSSKWSIQMIGV
jgi:hypothetical protein